MPTAITQDQLRRALELRDLTDPAAGPHAIQLVLTELLERLRTTWACDMRVHRAHPVVTVRDNYELLGYPADAPAREARYSRYVDAGRLLRTHSSAIVPAALRDLAAAGGGGDRDLLIACPGLVYRRDVVDRLHVGEPHQLDLWRLRSGRPLDGGDLDQMVEAAVAVARPGARHRASPVSHPYTTAGREVEVEVDGRWVELLECGLAAPAVLAGCGLDPGRWTGLALGIGLDRAVMLRKGVDDIRLLRAGDPRVAEQMLTLERYRPVSAMPSVTRDLSIAVRAGLTHEELGDRIRNSLTPDDLAAVEQVEVLAETSGSALSGAAVARIGLSEGQKNVLVRLVLRHPTRTLTSEDANRIRDQVYAAAHEGSVPQWAGSGQAGGCGGP